MSIFASWPVIGATEDGEPDGTVLWYLNSSRFPFAADPGMTVEIASIPAWCVPGHADADAEDSTDVGEYLRLTVTDEHDVILTEAAAAELHTQLGRWLDTPKRKAINDA